MERGNVGEMSGKACIGKDEAMILWGKTWKFPLKFLLGGDWNHGILNDFPETVANVIIPTDEVHDFSEG